MNPSQKRRKIFSSLQVKNRKMKKKKRGPIIGKILRILFLLLNIVASTALLLIFFAKAIAPTTWVIPAFLVLSFKYLLFINFGFVLLWIFFKPSNCLISLLTILINVNNIDRTRQFREEPIPDTCVNCVKVMSFNARSYGVYWADGKEKRNEEKQKIFNLLREEKPDILCIQEHFIDASGKLEFTTTDSLLEILNLADNKRYYQYFPSNRNNEYFFGYAIFSKYKIVNKGVVTTPDSSTIAIFADIKYKKDTIRVYDFHLASIHFDNEDYEIGKQLIDNKINDPKFNIKAKKITDKLEKAFIKREEQSQILHAHIDTTKFPVIVCGDMNDAPASYAYSKVGKHLKDAFRQSGYGVGSTYHGDAFPNFRIDYIFHDKRYKSFGYKTDTTATISDHYPVSCHISLFK